MKCFSRITQFKIHCVKSFPNVRIHTQPEAYTRCKNAAYANKLPPETLQLIHGPKGERRGHKRARGPPLSDV